MRLNRRIHLVAFLSLALSLGIGSSAAWFGGSAQAADQRLGPLAGNTIADIAEKASPAVVHLEMRRKMAVASQGGMPLGELWFNGQRLQLPNNFFQTQPDGEGEGPPPQAKPRAEGGLSLKPDIASGFIVRPDGYIVTNLHAVDGQDSIKVTLFDKRSYDAKVVGKDGFSDLAVIKIEAKDLPVLSWGNSASLRPGEFAVAIGSPAGEDHSVSFGIISAVGRTETDVNGNINFIQTDAAINPGNSGGPLLNLNGEVVGVNTAVRRGGDRQSLFRLGEPYQFQNIAYSIPADVARSVCDKLIASGSIDRPWLGITMSELEETYVKGQGLPADTRGVLINNFVEGSPALTSGLKKYDIVQKIDGKEMLIPKDVRDYVQSRKVGDTLNFIVLRGQKIEAVGVHVGIYPQKVKQR